MQKPYLFTLYMFVFKFYFCLFQLIIKTLIYLKPIMGSTVARGVTEIQFPFRCFTENIFVL